MQSVVCRPIRSMHNKNPTNSLSLHAVRLTYVSTFHHSPIFHLTLEKRAAKRPKTGMGEKSAAAASKMAGDDDHSQFVA